MWAAQPEGVLYTWGSGIRHWAPSQGSDWRGMFPLSGSLGGSRGGAARDREGSFMPRGLRGSAFLWKRPGGGEGHGARPHGKDGFALSKKQPTRRRSAWELEPPSSHSEGGSTGMNWGLLSSSSAWLHF